MKYVYKISWQIDGSNLGGYILSNNRKDFEQIKNYTKQTAKDREWSVILYDIRSDLPEIVKTARK